MKSIFRILVCSLLIIQAGLPELFAQCGPNTLEFQGVQKIYNTACGNSSYQNLEGSTPSGSGNTFRWEVSFSGGPYTVVSNSGIAISSKDLSKTEITNHILAPAGNAAGDYRIRRIVTNVGASCSNASQPVFLYYSQTSATINAGSISGNLVGCSLATGTLTIAGNTGPVLRWESAPSSGGPWMPISNVTNTLTYSGLSTATCYRAVIDNICDGNAGTFDALFDKFTDPVCITINSVPAITAQPANQGICVGSSLNLSVTATSATVMSYQWRKDGFNINGAVSATYTIGSVSNFDEGVYDVVITNSCGSVTSSAATVTVNPVPVATVPASFTVCPGALTAAAVFSSNPTGATFTWTNSDASIGLGASGSGNVPAFTAINTTTTSKTATITVTPILNGCAGPPSSYTITVNPTAVVTVPANFSVCSGETVSATNFSGAPAGTTFTWSNSNPAIGLPASGSGNVPSFTANTSGTATITVTPSVNGCAGTPSSYMITIYSLPIIISASKTNESICSANDGSITIDATGTAPLEYSIDGGNTYFQNGGNFASLGSGSYAVVVRNGSGCVVAGNILSITSPGAPAAPAIDPFTNPICEGTDLILEVTNPDINATYTWTGPMGFTMQGATITRFSADPSMSGSYAVTAKIGACVSSSTIFSVTVNMRPIISQPPNLTSCVGNTVLAADFISTPAGASYTWTNSNTNIGLAAFGSGLIPSFTASNGTNAPITATITVIPTLNGCTGDPVSYTITVNPQPAITQLTAFEVCHGSTIPQQTFASNVAGATFAWTVTGLGASFSGTGVIPPFTALNYDVTPLVGTVTVTATSGGCNGPTMSYSITVNPLPRVTNAPLNQVTCAGVSTTEVVLTSDVAGATFAWSAVASPGVTGFTASGAGNIPAMVISNSGTVAGTVTYTVYAIANSCQGPATTYVIHVNPVPQLLNPVATLSQTICSGNSSTIVNLASDVAGTTFNWTAVATGSITGFLSTGTDQTQLPSQTLFNTGTTAGSVTYTITPISNSGCFGAASVYTITVNPLPTAILTGDATVCYGVDAVLNVALTGTAPWTITYTDGTGFFTISGININSHNFTVSGNSTKTYTIQSVTDASCTNTGTGSATITQPTAPLAATANANNVSCFGFNNGSITFAGVSGGYGSYEYSIDGGATWQAGGSFTGLTPGTYNLQVKDAANCSFTVNSALIITQPSASLTAVICGQTNVLCFGASTGSACVAPSGGTAPYTYLWSNGATTASIANLAAGTYTVNVTDANGCTIASALSVTISQPGALSASLTSSDVSCFGGNNGSISIVSSSGGSGVYQYSIDGGTNWQTASVFNNLVAANYQVLVRDASATSCIYSINAAFAITQPSAAISASASHTNLNCFGANNGAITFLNSSGGSGTYQYSIDGGLTWQASATFTGLAAGIYNLQVRDGVSFACTFTVNNSLGITQPSAALTALVTSSTNVLCFGASTGSATAIATGGTAPYSYLWNNGVTSAALSNVPAGVYTVIITDANGCTTASPVSVTITQPAALSASSISSNVTCYGGNTGSVTILNSSGGSGNYEYSVNGGTSWQSGSLFTNLIAGTYNVLMRDASALNCIYIVNASLVITELAPLAATATTSDITCFGASDGTITFSNISGGSGSYQYSISNGSNWQNISSFSGLPARTYSLQVRDAANPSCILIVNGAMVLNQPAILTGTIEFKNVTCRGAADGSITIVNSSGGYGNYQFSKNGGIDWQSSPAFNNLAPGLYRVHVRDLSNPGCTQILSSAVEIRQASEPLISGITSLVNVNCFGSNTGSITLFVKGGVAPYTYLWTNGATSKDLKDVPAGVYTVVITDSYNCVSTQTITIAQPSQPLSISFNKTDVTCFGSNNGLISLSVTGGSAPYNYSWSNGRKTRDLSSLNAGLYTITVTDIKGCVLVKQISVAQPAQALAATIAKTNVTCFGAGDGTVSLNVTGGTAPYSYIWSNGKRTSGLSGVAPGTYTVTIADANGCLLKQSASITQPSAPLRMSLTIKNTVCKSSSDGTITAAITGGLTPYTLMLNGRTQTSNVLSGLAAGPYEITVKDASGCLLLVPAQVLGGVCAPVANDDAFKIYEGDIASGTTALNDFDRENENLTFSLSGQPKNGTIVFNSDGSFTYKPNAGFLGTETMPYKTCNASGICSSANLIIRVVTFTVVNLTPALANVREGKKVTITARLEKVFPDDVVIKIGYSGKAIRDRDYVLLDQFIQIMIPKGQLGTTQKLTIAALTDDIEEGDESIDIRILSTSDPDVRIGTAAIVTIGDVYPPEPIDIENKEVPINADISTNPLFSPNNDGMGNDVFNIVNIVSFPNNEVIIFNRWGNEVFRMKGYNESDRVFKGYANTGLLTNTNSPLADGVYYFLITTHRTVNGQAIKALNKGYLILKR